MQPILQTALQVTVIALPFFLVGLGTGKLIATRRRQNRNRYPYNITR